jgi:hypothetical protein
MAGTVNGVTGAATLATPGDAESGGIDTVEQPAINTTIVAKLRRSVHILHRDRVSVCHKKLVQSSWHGQNKFRDIDLERDTVFADTVVTATHRTHGCLERTAAGVLKGFAWTEQRLLTDHA